MRAPSASEVSPEYMASSEEVGSVVAASVAAGEEGARGLVRATTTAAARRGEMLVATSRGVVPRGTSRWEPSGSWMRMGS
jgi:hypothetical protein